MPLCVVDFFQVGCVCHFFYPLLQGDDLIIAGHHGYRAELKTLCQVHGTQRSAANRGLPGLGFTSATYVGMRISWTVSRISTNCAAPVVGWVSSLRLQCEIPFDLSGLQGEFEQVGDIEFASPFFQIIKVECPRPGFQDTENVAPLAF